MPTLEQAKARVRELRNAAYRKRLNLENKPPSQVDDEASFFDQSADSIEKSIKSGEFKSKKKRTRRNP